MWCGRWQRGKLQIKKPSQKFIDVDRELAVKAISLLQYLLLSIIIDFFVPVYSDALFSPAFTRKKYTQMITP